ncbi:hypothetical protein U1Q18_014148, partial [Sarracenia purpurea var. burkii]
PRERSRGSDDSACVETVIGFSHTVKVWGFFSSDDFSGAKKSYRHRRIGISTWEIFWCWESVPCKVTKKFGSETVEAISMAEPGRKTKVLGKIRSDLGANYSVP